MPRYFRVLLWVIFGLHLLTVMALSRGQAIAEVPFYYAFPLDYISAFMLQLIVGVSLAALSLFIAIWLACARSKSQQPEQRESSPFAWHRTRPWLYIAGILLLSEVCASFVYLSGCVISLSIRW